MEILTLVIGLAIGFLIAAAMGGGERSECPYCYADLHTRFDAIECSLRGIERNQLTEINKALKPLIASLNKSNTSLEDAVEAAGDVTNPTAGASS